MSKKKKNANQNYPNLSRKDISSTLPPENIHAKKKIKSISLSLSSRRTRTDSQRRKKRKHVTAKPSAKAALVTLGFTSSLRTNTYFYFDHLERKYLKTRVPWRTEIHVTVWGCTSNKESAEWEEHMRGVAHGGAWHMGGVAGEMTKQAVTAVRAVV